MIVNFNAGGNARKWSPAEAWDGDGNPLPATTFSINLQTGFYQHYVTRDDGSYVIRGRAVQSLSKRAPLPITIHRLS